MQKHSNGKIQEALDELVHNLPEDTTGTLAWNAGVLSFLKGDRVTACAYFEQALRRGGGPAGALTWHRRACEGLTHSAFHIPARTFPDLTAGTIFLRPWVLALVAFFCVVFARRSRWVLVPAAVFLLTAAVVTLSKPQQIAFATAEKAKLLASPTNDAPELGVLQPGDRLKLVAVQPEWVQVETAPGTRYWSPRSAFMTIR